MMKVQVAMHPLSEKGVGPRVGFIVVESLGTHGVRFQPELPDVAEWGLRPGLHGFHVHELGHLEPTTKDDGSIVPGGAAGSHYDPMRTNSHQGPWGNGHLGDLPALTVEPDGSVVQSVVAPRLRFNQIQGRALIVHLGGDNYTDTPPNGGGKRRVLGGVVTDDCPYCRPKGRTADALIGIGVGLLGLGVLVKASQD